MRKTLLIVFILGLTAISGVYFNQVIRSNFNNLSAEQMREQIISQRQIAIAKANEAGDYKCCINPPCTMCFDSANKWNYGQAGKCFCDEFIARGEEPCPQCQKGLGCAENKKHGSETEAYCDINLNL